MKISVVICTYNREKYILQALRSVVDQTYDPKHYEILVINNNSKDNTEKLCINFIEENKARNIRYVFEKRSGLSFARNTGILESTGELIAFIDDDAIAETLFIENAVKFMDTNKNVDAIGGKVDPVYNHGEPVWLSKYLWGLVTKTDLGNNVREFPKNTYPKYPAGCNMIFRRVLFGEVGMFNTDLKLRSDDKYIFLELFKYKKKIMYVPTVNVKHHIDDYRLTPEFIKKLSLIVGNSERVRLRNAGLIKNLEKIVEYKFKFFAALILAAGFAFRFEFQKAFYLVKNRWYVLLGFFRKMD